MDLQDLVEAIDLTGYEVESLVLFRGELLTRDIPVYKQEDASCAILAVKKADGAGEYVREVIYIFSSKETPLTVRRDKVGSLT